MPADPFRLPPGGPGGPGPFQPGPRQAPPPGTESGDGVGVGSQLPAGMRKLDATGSGQIIVHPDEDISLVSHSELYFPLLSVVYVAVVCNAVLTDLCVSQPTCED